MPGVYYLLTATRRLSYVGKAGNLRRRLGEHGRDPRWGRIAHVRWELMANEAAAAAREADVIVALQPARNRANRAEEYYSFVSIDGVADWSSATPAATGAFHTWPRRIVGARQGVPRRLRRTQSRHPRNETPA